MVTYIPAAKEIRQRLAPMTRSQLQQLAGSAAVPITTLLKIRSGETQNPGIETVRSFWPQLAGLVAPPTGQANARS